MSEPIKISNSFKWFRGHPHQEEAIRWLDAQLTDAQREEFGRRFRQTSPIGRALKSPTLVQLEMNWTKRYDARGFRIFRLALTNNGEAVDAVEVVSGNRATQDDPFIHPKDDYSQSGRCLPEGVYSLGRVEDSQLARNSVSWGEGLGRYWISLDILPRYKVNNRSAFGIHADANASYAPGSIGCVCPLNSGDLKKVIGWLNAKTRPAQLVCDLGLGFLRERGYQPPSVIAQQAEDEDKEELENGMLKHPLQDLDLHDQLARKLGVDSSTIDILVDLLAKRLSVTSDSFRFHASPTDGSDDINLPNPVFTDAEEGIA